MTAILAKLFGSDVATTLLGLAAFLVVEIANYLNALPAEVGQGWHYVAVGLLALGRFIERKSTKPADPAAPPAP